MLGDLIELLKQCPSNAMFQGGFCEPHSYRGYYSELAVEPCEDTPVTEMISCLEGVLDTYLDGYKGGEFKMDENVDVYLSSYGMVSNIKIVGYGIKVGGEYCLITEDESDYEY